jgi:peptide/nickel transport system permease protein
VTTLLAAAPATTRPRRTIARVLRRPIGVASLAFLVVFTVGCLGAEFVAPYDPLRQDTAQALATPSAAHWLGTDSLGRDVLSRLLHGGSYSLLSAALATAVAIAVGIPLGMIGGYFGRQVDLITSRYADLWQAIPIIIVLLAVIGVFGRDMVPSMLALGICLSAAFVRLARASTLAAGRELYVDAAKVFGLSWPRILARHVLPNVRGPLLVQATVAMATVLLIQAGLSFLGLGPPPPAPSWGAMISDATEEVYTAPWLLVRPGIALVLTILAFNFLGDALAEDRPVRSPRRPTSSPRKERWQHTSPAVTADSGVALRACNLHIEFGDPPVTVVDDVSFEVSRGESLGIVGESGCGKSVTARALLGLVAAGGTISGGQVLLPGAALVGMSERGLTQVRGTRIALVSQEPMVALDPSFTVGSQLREVIRRHTTLGRAASRQRALELLAQVGIPDPAATGASFPFQISGGTAQRVAIAMALAGEPDVLVADEPTTALDVTVQAEILDLLGRLRRDLGMALILVTHDLGVVADACDRAAVMYAGQIVEQGPVRRLLSAPEHPYTAGLLRSMPGHAPPGETLYAIDGTVPPPGSWPPGCRFAQRCPMVLDTCRSGPVPMLDGPDATRCLRVDEQGREREPEIMR